MEDASALPPGADGIDEATGKPTYPDALDLALAGLDEEDADDYVSDGHEQQLQRLIRCTETVEDSEVDFERLSEQEDNEEYDGKTSIYVDDAAEEDDIQESTSPVPKRRMVPLPTRPSVPKLTTHAPSARVCFKVMPAAKPKIPLVFIKRSSARTSTAQDKNTGNATSQATSCNTGTPLSKDDGKGKHTNPVTDGENTDEEGEKSVLHYLMLNATKLKTKEDWDPKRARALALKKRTWKWDPKTGRYMSWYS